MKQYHPLLLTPGPTPVPDEILHATQEPMVGHRSSDFEAIAQEAFQAIKPVFGTENEDDFNIKRNEFIRGKYVKYC